MPRAATAPPTFELEKGRAFVFSTGCLRWLAVHSSCLRFPPLSVLIAPYCTFSFSCLLLVSSQPSCLNQCLRAYAPRGWLSDCSSMAQLVYVQQLRTSSILQHLGLPRSITARGPKMQRMNSKDMYRPFEGQASITAPVNHTCVTAVISVYCPASHLSSGHQTVATNSSTPSAAGTAFTNRQTNNRTENETMQKA